MPSPSMEEIEFNDMCISLFDGGWRPEDAELMSENYDMPLDEAKRICDRIQELMDRGRLKETISERCPKCGSMAIDSESTMVERNFTMCYVTYRKCLTCHHVWEPNRTLDLPIGNGEYVKIPDGAYLIVEFPDGERWRKKLTYLDSNHFTLNNGHTWHVGQFRELMEENPGTKVSYDEVIASPNARNRSGGKKVSERPAFFSKWRRD